MTAYLENSSAMEIGGMLNWASNRWSIVAKLIKRVAMERFGVKRRLSRLTRLFSLLIGEPLTTGDVLRIIHAGVALMALLFPADINLFLRVAFLIWFIVAVDASFEIH